jgi:predicted Holliday junction resolvase-like endonuclease
MQTTLSDVYALLVLSFGVLSVLLLLVLIFLLKISYRLKRLDLQNASLEEDVTAEVATVTKTRSKAEASEFEKFLEEDGKRRMLSKREQAAAFRDWRKQRGVTWGKDTP